MSKEVQAPIIDTYRDTVDSGGELPEHLRNYGGKDFDKKGYASVRFPEGATKAEQVAHEAEMARIWEVNKELEDIFQTIGSEEFQTAHNQVVAQAIAAEANTNQLITALDFKNYPLHQQN